MTSPLIFVGLLVTGFSTIWLWAWWDKRRAAQKRLVIFAEAATAGYTVTEAGQVAAAISDAWTRGRTPIAYRVHRHPSGVPLVDVICAEDAVARAEELLEDAS